MIPIHRILVPTDFSEPADVALRMATTVAKEFDCELLLLHVVPEPYAYPFGTELSTLPMTDVLLQAEEASQQQLDTMAAATGLPASRVTTRAIVGTPVERILSTIDEDRIDLVVMGTHGRGLVSHLLLGSVAERIVRRSPVPVLTVPGESRRAAAKRGTAA